jgi:UDP-N-acetyl-D-mannosaminuronic acid dehydrogenase
VNIKKTDWVIDEIKKEHSQIQSQQEIPIVIYGMSYKPNVSDTREAPSVKIAKTLSKQGYKIFCIEPNLSELKEFDLISLDDGKTIIGLHVILVKHKEFKNIGPFTGNANRLLDYCGVL